LKVGVVGVGAMGQHHARVYAELPDCELVGVHDIDAARAGAIAAEFGAAAYEELDALLAAVDAVTVAVPTPLHHDIGLRCLRAGCDALIEKPLAPSLQEADELIAAAAAGDRILQVGHIERYNPAVAAMTERVGRPGFIEVDRLGSLVPRSLETDVVLDLMIHDIDIVHALVDDDDVIEVRAVGVPILTDAIDFANARLEFSGGCIANLTASRVSVNRIRKVRVFQPEAYLSVDYTAQTVDHYRLLRRDGKPSGIDVDRIDASGDEPLRRQLVDFLESCGERREPLASGRAARRALDTALRILSAIEARMTHSATEGPK
jgi:predicted dehydrogenase